jgi:ABC-type Fe3+ transport system permease subunit
MSNWDFLRGLLTGFVMAGVFGFVLQKLRLAQKKAGEYKKPQSVTQKTDKTPIEVVRSSIIAWLSSLFWTVVLIVVLVGFFWGVFWLISTAE